MDITRSSGRKDLGTKMLLTMQISVAKKDFTLVSVGYQLKPKGKKRKKSNVHIAKKYDAAVHMPPFDVNSDWFVTLATDPSLSSSFEEMQDDNHLHYHSHLLLYVRTGSGADIGQESILIQKGHLFMHE